MAEGGLYLEDVIVNLRRALKAAQEKAAVEDLRFVVEDIEIELNAVLKEEAGVTGGVKFWVLNAEAAGKVATEATQKIRLKLKPKLGRDPLEIAGRTTLPGSS